MENHERYSGQADIDHSMQKVNSLLHIPSKHSGLKPILDLVIVAFARYYRGKAFIEAAGYVWDEGEETVVLSLLNQGIEQLCVGLIYIFLGYRPNQHSLNHLFDLWLNFTPLIDTIFPRDTPEDMRIFKLLSKSANSGRFMINVSVDPNDIGLLYRRRKILTEKSESLVVEHLEKIKTVSRS